MQLGFSPEPGEILSAFHLDFRSQFWLFGRRHCDSDMTLQKPDPDTLSDMIDSLRAVGLGEDNAALAQMAEMVKALASADPAVWATLDGLRDDPAGLADLLASLDQSKAPRAEDHPGTPPDQRG